MQYIFHIDMDAFYASCEELKNPELKNFPIAVGGTFRRSIITTANYKARQFGIKSAMPVFIAQNLCPKLKILPLDRPFYIDKSNQVFEIIKKYSPTFERVSIDECYIQIECLDPLLIAKQIKNDIKNITGLTASVGISYNKFLSKLASDWNKPDGLKMIKREELHILHDLDIIKVNGIGKKTVAKLNSFGIYKIRDLLKLDRSFLYDMFGLSGNYIYDVIRGIDNRKIETDRKRKSIGEENTFDTNTNDIEILKDNLKEIASSLSQQMKDKNIVGKTINLKIKTDNFITHTKSLTLNDSTNDFDTIRIHSEKLLEIIYDGKNLRLIGISLSNLSTDNYKQIRLFK